MKKILRAARRFFDKGQGGLEFLMTYGWTIFIVVIAGAALWYSGVFNPQPSEKQVFFDVLTGLDVKADTGGNLTITFGNNLGRDITLTGTAEVDGVTKTLVAHNGSSLTLKPGGRTTVVIVNAFASNQSAGDRVIMEKILVDYADSKSAIAYRAKGSVQAEVEEATASAVTPVTLFQWFSQTHFDAGTHSGSVWSVNGLTTMGTQGEWESDVKDAMASISWTTLSWSPELNYGQGLSQEQGVTVALWHFDENGGCTAVDASSFASNGVFQPCTVGWQTGKVNHSLHLDGTEAVNVSYSNGVMDLVQNYSFAGWIWRSGDGNEDRVWARGPHWFKLFSGNTVRVLVSGVGELAGTRVVPLNQWTHVALTVRRTKPGYSWLNNITLYVNGVVDAQTLNAYGTPVTSQEPLYLGRAPPGQAGNNWAGYFDEFTFTNRTLNTTEIQRLYQQADNELYFQVRSGNSNPLTNNFIGPNGATNTYYRTTPATLNVSSARYFQVYALLTTSNSSLKPKIYNITAQGAG